MRFRIVVLIAVCGLVATLVAAEEGAGYAQGQAYACGDRVVFLIDVAASRGGEAKKLWQWTAAESPQIRAEDRDRFRATDDCKPVRGGAAVLVCSSTSGGVALIRRADKACLFYAQTTNAHSADLIGDDLLAVALSNKGDELRIYRMDGQVTPAKEAAWKMPLAGGHGVVWDAKREALWVMGSKELLKLKLKRGTEISGEVVARWMLAEGSGHDLFPWDQKRLGVTTEHTASLFDVEKETFELMPGMQNISNIKSVSRDAQGGKVLYTQGEPTFTKSVRFVDGEPIGIGEIKGYKARWNGANAFVLNVEPNKQKP